MDFFLDRLAREIALEHIEKFSWKPEERAAKRIATWKAETRLMFQNFPTILVYDIIDECLKEASDEQYFEQKIYNKSQKSTKISISKKFGEKGKYRKLIDDKIKITDIAKKFGLNPDSKGKILCPFHADGDPSCSLNDKKNIFHCFGCGAKGDITEFYRRLKDESPRSN